jgi:transposase
MRHTHKKEYPMTSFSLSRPKEPIIIDQCRRDFSYQFQKSLVKFLECSRELRKEYPTEEKFWYRLWKENNSINELPDTFRLIFEHAYQVLAYFLISMIVSIF